ncbi:MAG: hypothetical protein ABIQ55_12580 [Gemmatimonadaceae bacterium]
MIPDPHADLLERVFHEVLEAAGETSPALRKSVSERTDVPAELQDLVDKIHCHAYKVTDEDMGRLQSKYGDDKMFEIVVNAALGASRQRLLAGLDALDAA